MESSACVQAYQVSIRPQSERGARGDRSAYYHWRDLAVGRTIQVFGRELLLTGADDTTQRFYQERAGASEGDFRPVEVRGASRLLFLIFGARLQLTGLVRCVCVRAHAEATRLCLKLTQRERRD